MASTVTYEVRTEGFTEGTFDDREAAQAFLLNLDDGRPLELVKVTETVLKTRNRE